MEDIDGGLHPAVDGQNLDEDEDEDYYYYYYRHYHYHYCVRLSSYSYETFEVVMLMQYILLTFLSNRTIILPFLPVRHWRHKSDRCGHTCYQNLLEVSLFIMILSICLFIYLFIHLFIYLCIYLLFTFFGRASSRSNSATVPTTILHSVCIFKDNYR